MKSEKEKLKGHKKKKRKWTRRGCARKQNNLNKECKKKGEKNIKKKELNKEKRQIE